MIISVCPEGSAHQKEANAQAASPPNVDTKTAGDAQDVIEKMKSIFRKPKKRSVPPPAQIQTNVVHYPLTSRHAVDIPATCLSRRLAPMSIT
jgi:hypothetical protein